MDPQLGRRALAAGLTLFILSLLTLVLLPPGNTPAFVTGVLALVISVVFLLVVGFVIWWFGRLPLGPDPEEDEDTSPH